MAASSVYDYAEDRWDPQCPHGDLCTGCDAEGRCSRMYPAVNGRPLPPGVTMSDWMQLHMSPGFYDWLNAVRGCGKPPQQWRLAGNVGWCGI